MSSKSFKQAFLFIIVSVILNSPLLSQSLSPERIAHIKECTVRITIEGSPEIGTGFFIDSKGTLITCWHVIAPAINRDSLTNIIIGAKKIFVHLNTNENLEYWLPRVLYEKAYDTLRIYDICVLTPNFIKHPPLPFLKLGDFNKIKEGQEIITCGYPLAIKQQFVTKGILSTKYMDTIGIIQNNILISKTIRSQALLDLTINKGNSGGAIIALGKTINDDMVIGIADFIIIPIGANAEALSNSLKEQSGILNLGGFDTNILFSEIISVLGSTSVGISGCVSINHASYLIELVDKYNSK